MSHDTRTTIKLMTSSATAPDGYTSFDVDDVLARVRADENVWIHVDSLHDTAAVTRILEHFGLPAALAQQIDSSVPLESETRSDRYVFKKFRFLAPASGENADVPKRKGSRVLIREARVDALREAGGVAILGEKFLLSFDDRRASQLFDAARVEIRSRNEIHRGIDYVFYRLLKILVVDNYAALFRQFADRIQDTEDILLEGTAEPQVYQEAVRLRRELNPFGMSLLYAHEFARLLVREKPAVLSEASLIFFSENLVADAAALEEEYSLLRGRTSELMQMHRDNANTQLNNIMRTLTVISTVFLPLSFITSFYGMNFPNMPALKWNGSFPIMLGVMAAMSWGILYYARKHRWL